MDVQLGTYAPPAGVTHPPRPRSRRADLAVAALFTVTSFVASSLLFAVEPMVGKLVLPLYGGAASVWNVCLVFFQTALVLGYLYSHATWRVLRHRQPWLHVVVLALPLLAIPLALPAWSPPPPDAPAALWLLLVLAVSVGLPFLVVCTSAPLLQAWFSATDHRYAADPYFLYAAGNAGSLIALLAYPFLLEPALTVRRQTQWWSAGYIVLIALLLACTLVARARRQPAHTRHRGGDATHGHGAANGGAAHPRHGTAPVAVRRRLWWLLLAALPSSALLGVTTYLSTDVAALPLLWVVPLALYLATFVAAFAQRRTGTWRYLGMPILTTAVAMVLLRVLHVGKPFAVVATLPLILFTLVAYACHSRLADDRPPAAHLTRFYVLVAVGGVLGGAFNSFLAPLVFRLPVEYALVSALALVVLAREFRPLARPGVTRRTVAREFRPLTGSGVTRRTVAVAAAVTVAPLAFAGYALHHLPTRDAVIAGIILLACLGVGLLRPRALAPVVAVLIAVSALLSQSTMLTTRSFFGVYRVTADGDRHLLTHGTTAHGAQDMRPGHRGDPQTYYTRPGPLGDVFAVYDGQGAVTRFAAVGLGVGTVAAYARPGDDLTVYELDQRVVDIAENPTYFTYLRDTPATVHIVVGDGRLEVAKAPAGGYQMIVLDAFSSDAIPVHLLTTEAFAMYRTKLTPDGVLVVHISNAHLDLEPVVDSVATATRLHALTRLDTTVDKATGRIASQWVALAEDATRLAPLADLPGWRPLHTRPGTTWTDDYSNIVGILKLN